MGSKLVTNKGRLRKQMVCCGCLVMLLVRMVCISLAMRARVSSSIGVCSVGLVVNWRTIW